MDFPPESPLPRPDLCEALGRVAAASPDVWGAVVVAEIVRLLARRDGLFWSVALIDAIFFDAMSQRRRDAFVADGEGEFFERHARRHAAKGARP